jgi:hypothetical protein
MQNYHPPEYKNLQFHCIHCGSILSSLGRIFTAGIDCMAGIPFINLWSFAFANTAKNGRIGTTGT